MLLIRRCRCGHKWRLDVPHDQHAGLAAIWAKYHAGDGHGPPEEGRKEDEGKEDGHRDAAAGRD